jgi:hypothetical protein
MYGVPLLSDRGSRCILRRRVSRIWIGRSLISGRSMSRRRVCGRGVGSLARHVSLASVSSISGSAGSGRIVNVHGRMVIRSVFPTLLGLFP